MSKVISIPSVVGQVSAYVAAVALGLAISTPYEPIAVKTIFFVIPAGTLFIARRRTRTQTMATVHSISEWQNTSTSDTTLAIGAVAHPLAL